MDEITTILYLVTLGLFILAWVKHDQRGLYFLDTMVGVCAISALVNDTAVNPDLLYVGFLPLVICVLMGIAGTVYKPAVEVV